MVKTIVSSKGLLLLRSGTGIVRECSESAFVQYIAATDCLDVAEVACTPQAYDRAQMMMGIQDHGS